MRYLLLLLISISVCSCNNSNSSVNNESKQTVDLVTISQEAISNLQFADYLLDNKAIKITDTWTSFNELDLISSALLEADLSFFNSDKEILKALNKDLIDNIPEAINSQSIIARLKVVETKMYKLQSAVSLNTTTEDELLQAVKEMLVANSNLRLQINKHLERNAQAAYKQ